LITFSNIGADGAPSFTLPARTAIRMLDTMIEAGHTVATSRWELELVAWIADRRWALNAGLRGELDLVEVAWTPEHFADQQSFLIDLCDATAARAEQDAAVHGGVMHLRALVAAHRRARVPFGRRWRWLAGCPDLPSVALAASAKP
jgi:hypothetical protein